MFVDIICKEKCNQILDFKKLTEELEKRKQQQKEVNELENELRKEITILKNKFEKKTEIDNFIMDSLGAIAMEMVQTQGIDSIKDIFRKYNVPLVRDK